MSGDTGGRMSHSGDEISEAIRLWDELRTGFLWSTDTIEKIIAKEAWKPLGYQSFFEAWNDKMADIELAKQLNIRVVAQFLEEGVDPDRVALAVNGLGPVTVANIQRELANGVPASVVRGTSRPQYEKPVFVPSHRKELPSERHVIKIDVGSAMRAESERIAKALHLSVSELAKDIYLSGLKELARTMGKPKRVSA